MQRIARGRGIVFPMLDQAAVQSLFWSAFIGLPCPKKMAGMELVILVVAAR